MDSENDYDMMFKLVIIGDSYVGKTNIMTRYLNNEFRDDSKATVGVEFGSKLFNIENHKVKAQIWDTAGQERYKSITNAYYKGALGALVVYDITRKETFNSVDRWISDLQAVADKKISILIIGNKCDLEDQRQISKEQGEEKGKSFNAAFLETSASSGNNVSKAFEMLMKETYDKCHSDFEDDAGLGEIDGGTDIVLDKNAAANNEKKNCC